MSCIYPTLPLNERTMLIDELLRSGIEEADVESPAKKSEWNAECTSGLGSPVPSALAIDTTTNKNRVRVDS